MRAYKDFCLEPCPSRGGEGKDRRGFCPEPRRRGVNLKGLLDESIEDKVKIEEMKIIPANRCNDYWADRKLIAKDLKKYNKVSGLYEDINRRIIDNYSYSAMSVLRHAYGSCIPVIKHNIEHYKTLLKIYEEHKDEYNLAYPSFPEEFLVRRIIPDDE